MAAATKELNPTELKKLAAEADRAKADAELARAEARLKTAEAQSAEALVCVNEISALDVRRQEDRYLAGNFENRRYLFTGGVTAGRCNEALATLAQWHRLDKLEGVDPRPIEFIINSPGGDVIDGMALYNYLRHLSAEGHHITTGTLGYAASMGGILLQAGDHRWMGSEAYLMIHEISAGTAGKVGEIKDDVKFYEMICARVVDIFVKKSNGKMTAARFRKAWERIDWWIQSDDALKYGFVDEIKGT